MKYELYVITDPVLGCGRSHEEITRLAIDGGAEVVQLRDKRVVHVSCFGPGGACTRSLGLLMYFSL